jgi:hypothetical protein
MSIHQKLIKRSDFILIPIITLFLLSFSTQFLYAQKLTKFSKEPEAFISEIKAMFKEYSAENVVNTVSTFTDLIKKQKYTTEELSIIVETANEMLKKHYNPSPNFENYLNVLIAYKTSNIDIVKLKQYNKIINELIDVSKKNVDNMNETMLALFKSNIIYNDQSKAWYITTTNYTISINNKIPQITINVPIELYCRTKEDTVQIHKTSGTFYPLTSIWTGSKGRIDWRRVYLDTNSIYADINTYKIDMSKAEISADSVWFVNKFYFRNAIQGKVHDKAMTIYKGENASFPEFRSYRAGYVFDKISRNVLFIGGFSMAGKKMLSTSSSEKKARILISFKGVETMMLESEAFSISSTKISSPDVAVTIFYEGDSMYHPKMKSDFFIVDRKIILTRGESGLYRVPMFDSYHGIDMEFDQLEWNIDDALMNMKVLPGSEASAMFSSRNYYSSDQYIAIQSILDFHPLKQVKSYAEKIKNRHYNIQEFSNFMGMKPENLQAMLIDLAVGGYIIFDINTGDIWVRDKTILYVNANYKIIDYDNIRFESTITKRSNAVFSLNSGKLELEGIRSVHLSDTHRVYIAPANQKITLKRDMYFEFSGYIQAGRFEFYGKDFKFDYKNFKINMDNIDSLRIFIPDPNMAKDMQDMYLVRLQNVLENISGYLYIDKFSNKSGRINFSEYPIFECKKHAYVYYDNPAILGGVYKRDKLYFDIVPFTIDSIDKFKVENLIFEGTFYSGDIIPVLKYQLKPQKDLSLGFVRSDKYPLYVGKTPTGKGSANIALSLNYHGLRGNGEINYLTTVTKSDDFIFFFDSTRANSQSYHIDHMARGIYPKVDGQDVFTQWYPYKDTMWISVIKKPFYIFVKNIEFRGNLCLTPERLISKGQFIYKNAELNSKLFVFTATKVKSDDANLLINSTIPDKLAFRAPNTTIDLDVEKDIAVGEANKGDQKFDLPYNQYITTQKHFVWNITEEKIELSKGKTQMPSDLYLQSTHSEQNGLKFQSESSTYFLKNYRIYAHKVPYIPVADARIYPDSQEVEILIFAEMRSLNKAKIKTDTINFYHTIYDAFVNVFSKNKYTGYGKYDYFDMNKTKQVISFYQIRVDENQRTFALGKITDSTALKISPRFNFYGTVQLNGNIKALDYNGFVLPVHDIKKIKTAWINFHDRINPDSVYLTISNPKNTAGKDLFTGIYMGADSPYVYHSFMGAKKSFMDQVIFNISDGVLYYDYKKNIFVYTPKDMIFEGGRRGSYFSINTVSGDMYSEGKFDFGTDIQNIDIKNAGGVNYTAASGKYLFDVLMTINFKFDDNALKKISNSIIENADFKSVADEGRYILKRGAAEMVDEEKERKKVLKDMDEISQLGNDNKTFNKTFVFSQLKVTWDTKNRMFQTSDNLMGISSINKAYINKVLKGGLDLTKRRSGSVFDMYFETDKNTYFYFSYKNGIFNVLSSDNTFNENVKASMQKYSEAKYRINIATNREIDLMKRKINFY